MVTEQAGWPSGRTWAWKLVPGVGVRVRVRVGAGVGVGLGFGPGSKKKNCLDTLRVNLALD